MAIQVPNLYLCSTYSFMNMIVRWRPVTEYKQNENPTLKILHPKVNKQPEMYIFKFVESW